MLFPAAVSFQLDKVAEAEFILRAGCVINASSRACRT